MISAQGGAVVFDVDAGKELAAAFPTGKAAIHQNHGLFTVGETVDEAAFWFISMERSCQAQLLAMAAGQPKKINHEFATRADRVPARRLVQLPAALAGHLRPTQSCSSSGSPALSVCPWSRLRRRVTAPPGQARFRSRPVELLRRRRAEPLFVLSAIAQYGRDDRHVAVRRGRPANRGVAARRQCRRRADPRLPGALHRWTRPQLLAAAVFGIATALMNTFFFMGLARTDLGKSVAIEFIGPIAVAAAMTRTARNAEALLLAASGSSSSAASRSATTRSGCCGSSPPRRCGRCTS